MERLVERARQVAADALFRHVARGAAPECLADHVVGVVHAEKHDRRAAESGRVERSNGLKAVAHGHFDVHDDDVRAGVRGFLDRLRAVGRDTHHIEVRREQRRHHVQDLTMVVDDEHSRLFVPQSAGTIGRCDGSPA